MSPVTAKNPQIEDVPSILSRLEKLRRANPENNVVPSHKLNDVFGLGYRRGSLLILDDAGLVESAEDPGYVVFKSCAWAYDDSKLELLLPSLYSLRHRRDYLGDPDRVEGVLPKGTLVTLTRGAFDLVGKDARGEDLYFYLLKPNEFVKELGGREREANADAKVHVLEPAGNLDDKIWRVYLDCIAAGGRGPQAAAFLEILMPEKIKEPILSKDFVESVRETMPRRVDRD